MGAAVRRRRHPWLWVCLTLFARIGYVHSGRDAARGVFRLPAGGSFDDDSHPALRERQRLDIRDRRASSLSRLRRGDGFGLRADATRARRLTQAALHAAICAGWRIRAQTDICRTCKACGDVLKRPQPRRSESSAGLTPTGYSAFTKYSSRVSRHRAKNLYLPAPLARLMTFARRWHSSMLG